MKKEKQNPLFDIKLGRLKFEKITLKRVKKIIDITNGIRRRLLVDFFKYGYDLSYSKYF